MNLIFSGITLTLFAQQAFQHLDSMSGVVTSASTAMWETPMWQPSAGHHCLYVYGFYSNQLSIAKNAAKHARPAKIQ